MPEPLAAREGEIVLRDLKPNAGIEVWYRRTLQALIEDMARSMLVHVRASLRRSPVEIGFGVDESPTAALERTFRKWGERWTARFDKMAKDVADAFATRSGRDFDARFRKLLREAGFTVKFQMSERMRESYRAVAAENVNLIRSIPQKFLTDVQSAVWQSVTKGYDTGTLSQTIHDTYKVSWRRAALIARDQTNKAKAVMEEARRDELGITEAIWIHSHAGKEPRPEHVRWGREKKRYAIKQGMWSEVDQEWVWPGTPINCRCTSRSIIPGFEAR